MEDVSLQRKIQTRELYVLGQELSVDICTPSSVKGTRWIPHVPRALKVFLRHRQDKDLAADEGQYSVFLQHINNSGSSRAGKEGYKTEGESERLHGPHQSLAEAARRRPSTSAWWMISKRARRPTYKSSWTTDILCV